MRRRTIKNMIISVVCASVLFMGVGYAYISETKSNLGVADGNASLNVVFTSVKAHQLQDNLAIDLGTSIATDAKTVTFDVNLIQTGDKILYTIEAYNQGSADAVVRNINVKEQTSSDVSGNKADAANAVKYVVEGLSEGAVIPSGSKVAFTVSAEYDNTSKVEGAVQKRVTVSLDYKVAVK
ncbi:MAG: hypothetical protein HFG15_04835 [Bacilli bacterium]|nr:hypothetical protein [Bacilli bacterium]